MLTIVYDIETTGLSIDSNIHCIGLQCILDDQIQPVKCYTSLYTPNSNGNLRGALKLLKTADILVGHNSISYDTPLVEHFFNTKFKAEQFDTLLLSKLMFNKEQLMNMDRGIPLIESKDWGKYSLDTFGKRLGTFKDHYEDWTKLTTEMVDYCKQDVKVTTTLYNKLLSMPNFPTQKVIAVENQVLQIINQQEQNGIYFDKEKAKKLSLKLTFEKISIENKLAKQFRPMFLPDGKPQKTNRKIKRKLYIPNDNYKNQWIAYTPYYKPLKRFKSGKLKLPAKNKYKYFNTPHKLIYIEKEGEFQNIKLTKFTATDNQIKVWLKRLYNFEFTTYTDKGNVRVDRDDLEALGDYGKNLRRLMKVKKDLSQLSDATGSLFNNIREDSTISTHIDTNGTATGRFTSNSPNLSQIPSQQEFRELFCVPSNDYDFIGTDFDGAENVVLSELLYPYDNGNLDHIINHGNKSKQTDLHSLNAKAMSLPTHTISRDDGKSIWFGKLYGSSPTLTGFTILGNSDYTNYTTTEFEIMEKKLKKRAVNIKSNSNLFYPIKKGQLVLFNEQLIKQALFGKYVQEKLTENTIGLAELERDLAKQYHKTKSVGTLGGRVLHVNSSHKMLNYSCQGANAEAIKYYLIEYHKQCEKLGMVHGYDYKQNLCIYDEVDITCKKKWTPYLKDILKEAYTTISRQLGMQTTFTGEIKIGDNWWQVH